MDEDLKTLIALARKRGSRYLKKDFAPEEVPEKMAELGVFLLEEYDRLKELKKDASTIEDLNEIQQRIDHFRQGLFALKRKLFG